MLHALTISLSAFLLFAVQPVVAKQILPWFGGSAGVWTTCLVFFQLVLLAGYAYGDALQHLRPRTQARIHTALLAASVLVLPLAPSPAWKAHDPARPIATILLLLATTVGLPFFALSTTGPLVQSWSARAHASDRVYRLYALSNAASLLALLAYPVAIEPLATLRVQSLAWSAAYVAFALCAGASAWRAAFVVEAGAAPERPRAAPPTVPEQALWFVLAAIPSVLLLGTTAHLTQDVASIPFLWVVPLAIYLVTFVLCFDRTPPRPAWRGSAAAVLAAAMLTGQVAQPMPFWVALPLDVVGLFGLCLFCHGELAAAKPHPAHLTRFYLMISAGGAAGGLAVGVLAPMLLPATWELSIALCAVAILRWALVPEKTRWVGAGAVAATCVLFGIQLSRAESSAVELSRNFYGSLRVERSDPGPDATLRLVHGVILHGEQRLDPSRRLEPTSYYGYGSGVDHAIRLLRPGPLRVGLVGMGAGTLSAYARPGDVFRYYELNPAVVDHARRHFTFLDSSPALTQVIVGDARLGLERDPPQAFDLLVVDAFSSDSIPAHLLTREAVALYRSHLRPGGIVAFHVSNRHLALAPVVAGVAEANGLRAWTIDYDPPPESGLSRSIWTLASEDADLGARLATHAGARRTFARGRTWTDDYGNLLGALPVLQPAEPEPEALARAR